MYPMPSEEIQRDFTGRSGESTMAQAREFYSLVRSYALDPQAVLDFGCGWGRITRCALEHLPTERITGCDPIPEMIALCRRMLPCRFIQIDPLPPSPFDSASFDLIYAYSVFSHLSEAAANAWIAEFKRILSPGGTLVITTRGDDFIPKFATLPNFNRIQEEAIATLIEGYKRGDFIHVASAGGYNLSDSFYGETAIPVAYIEKNWPLKLIDWIQGLTPHVDQYIAVLRAQDEL